MKVQLYNYIPHLPKRYITFNRWQKHYEKHLKNLYNNFIDYILYYYPNNNFNFSKFYILFCKMLYEYSSKYLQ
jgi:hypothetical protein